MTNYGIIVIDLGGTRLRAALCTPDGEIQKRVETKTRAQEGPEAVLDRICHTARQVWPDNQEIKAIGVSAPGPLDPFKGIILEAPNLPGWKDIPLQEILEERLQCPTCVGNDANLAALGEHRFGAGQGIQDMIYMTISTGIGGGIITGGELLLGHKGLAGEIGHIVVQPGGPLCGCGNHGCLEALASGTAIGHQAQRLAVSGHAAAILEAAGGDIAHISSKSVSQAAAKGDQVAIKLIQQAGYHIGIGIANLMHLFNPRRFILGGGVSQAGDLLFEPIRKTVRRWTMTPLYWQETDIVPAALGDDAGLLGALALVNAKHL